jgi:hypothetical protein
MAVELEIHRDIGGVNRHLVVDRGWSDTRFERWYADTLKRLLLDPVIADASKEAG